MADENDDAEKTEEPSSHKLEEFRKKGDVASSRELNSVLVLSAAFLSLGLGMAYIYEQLASYVEWLYSLPVDQAFQEEKLNVIVSKSAMTAFKCAGPVVFTALIIGCLTQIAQIGFLYSPEILELNWDRVNPINGMKKVFSMRSIVEALKGVLKFVFIMGIVFYTLKDDINSYQGFLQAEFSQAFLFGKDIIFRLCFNIIMGLLFIAIGDLAYQKYSYRKRLMMTKQEAKREAKEQEGSPEIKQRIRTIQREMANKRMMADIPKADVVVTNPTHLSVVIQYDKNEMVSPKVIGKGADHMALRIREIAKQHNIPIVENVPLARALHKTVKVGGYVPRNLYKAVAEVLAFVYRLKRKEKALR